jgi:hypothetical protein
VREQQNNVNIEVAELPAGMYMVTTSQNGQIMGRAKLVKN